MSHGIEKMTVLALKIIKLTNLFLPDVVLGAGTFNLQPGVHMWRAVDFNANYLN